MKVQLNFCSQYSLLQSMLSVSQIIAIAKQNELEYVGLSDHLNMSGCFEFYFACQKANLKPIFGLHIDVLHHNEKYTTQLIAKNNEGFKHLLQISTLIAYNGYQPIELSKLDGLCKGVICLLSDEGSIIAHHLLIDEEHIAKKAVLHYQSIFEDVYFGLSSRSAAVNNNIKDSMRVLASNLNITCIVSGRVAFLDRKSTQLSVVLDAMKKQTVLSFEQVSQLHHCADDIIHDDSFYDTLFTQQEIEQTLAFAQSLNVVIEKCQDVLVPFDNRKDLSSKDYLRALCYKGLDRRFNSQQTNNYIERLNFELDVITSMHFEDYFLVVYDYILYAKKNHFLVGPGRGSVTGSLVAYALGITQVDPIKYNLFFERFLNPQRASMPDIDIDFSDEDREHMIEYVTKKYGQEHVCHIMTYGTLKAKMALRDVGRVFGIQSYQVDMLTKAIPNVLNITLDEAYEQSLKLRNVLAKYSDLMQVYHYARQLENLVRHVSVHAAGIILSKVALNEIIALQPGPNQTPMAQHTMYDLEKRGLLKMDFLGIRNLSIISSVLNTIELSHGVKIDLNAIALDDVKTLNLIAAGDTDGVFQLESAGMKQLLRKVKVNQFSDIYACNALFRPGPMDNIDVFVQRKHNLVSFDYIIDDLEPILSETYGIIIYQEQIMQIVQMIGGFSLAQADLVRKAMSKKEVESLQSMKQRFIEGGVSKGYDKAKVEQLYEWILKFSNYGFNKGHSVAYSLLAYQMAYLKANYPLAFMSCVLTKMIGSEAKISEYIYACHRYGIKILPCSLNYSDDTFRIDQNTLRYPLVGIKSVGKMVYQQIVQERELRGPFTDEIDAIVRLSFAKVSSKVIQTLIEAGAFDEFTPLRSCLLFHLPQIIQYGNLIKVELNGQAQLDETMLAKPHLTPVYENKRVQLEAEFQALGLYLSSHPTSFYESEMHVANAPSQIGKSASFVLLLHFVRQIRTKKGEMMAFAMASDQTGQINLTFLPLTYSKYINFIQKEHVVRIYGKIEYGNELSLLVNRVEAIENHIEVKK